MLDDIITPLAGSRDLVFLARKLAQLRGCRAQAPLADTYLLVWELESKKKKESTSTQRMEESKEGGEQPQREGENGTAHSVCSLRSHHCP